MAHSSPVVTSNTEDDAEFRAWAQAIHDALIACGCVQTADTGQINLATVLRPASNADGGYEVWRLNDADQGTDPVYFKVTYGSATQPRQRITVLVGQGSNGTGTITGTTVSTVALQTGTNTAGALTETYQFAGDGSYVWMFLGPVPAQGGTHDNPIIGIGRLRDAAGAAVAGRHYLAFSDSSSATNQIVRTRHPSVGWSTSETVSGFSWPGFEKGGHITNVGGDIPLAGAVVMHGGDKLYLKELLAYPNAQLADAVTFSATHLGTSHTWRTIAVSDAQHRPFMDGGVGDSGNGLAVLWE